jgi:AraC-like DNA-binding protein
LRLDYRMPGWPLRPYLTVHSIVEDVGQPTVAVLPAMLPNLHIRIAGHSAYSFGDGPPIEAPRVTLIGPTSTSYCIHLSPDLVMLSIGILPLGWMALLRLPAVDCQDLLIDGEDVWGRAAIDRLCDQLAQTRDEARQSALIEAFVGARLQPTHDRRLSFASAIDHWLERSPDLCLDQLSETLDVGARHMRRLTMESHGVSPKVLAMKYRALRAATALVMHGAGGRDDSLRAFADQAHLTRDFRRFVGWTPAAFMREAQNIAAGTIAGRLRAGATRPLTLWS